MRKFYWKWPMHNKTRESHGIHAEHLGVASKFGQISFLSHKAIYIANGKPAIRVSPAEIVGPG